jgi:hypothetical protein
VPAWRLKEFEEWGVLVDLMALQELLAVGLRRKTVLLLDDEVEVGSPAAKKVVAGMVALSES